MKLTGRHGEYKVIRQLNEGSFARVMLARDANKRPVALKVLMDVNDNDAVERFAREQRILSGFHHPNVVPLVDDGVDEKGHPWYAMPAYETDLVSVIGDEPGAGRVAELVGDIARALAAYHDRGGIHRDLKPDNVLMDGDTPRLADFGVARCPSLDGESLTRTALGTVEYMAPEVWRGEASPKSDIFALGIVLWELANGTRRKFSDPGPPPESLDAGPQFAVMNPLYQQMTAKDASSRPTAAEVVTACDEIIRRSVKAGMSFTEAQIEAIQHSGSHLQLIACAGSGKTEVVARRVATLLDPAREPRLSPANIVAFTFTEKAAGELKQRIVERTRDAHGEVVGMAEMFVGTIHAFCLELLTTEVPEYMKYEVFNAVQQSLFIDRNSRKSGLTATVDLNGKPLRRYLDTPHYSSALQILREDDVDDALVSSSLKSGLAAYQALLAQHHYLDYSAIMDRAVIELETNDDFRKRIGERIKHVIVDEYQDVNPIQERLVRAMADAGAHVCVVGDDDQTIYQWRGSDVSNILTFKDRYANVHQVRLQENFRSSEGVIDLAREFIKQNQHRLDKAMVPTNAQPYEKGDIVALGHDTPEEEARYIAETIKELVGVAFTDADGTRRGLSWSDMAILFRSVAKNAAPVIAALDEAGIPYVVEGMNNLFHTHEAEAARQLFYFMDGRMGANELAAYWRIPRFGFDSDAVHTAVANASKARSRLLNNAGQEHWSLYNLQRQFMSFLEDLGLKEENISDGEVVLYNLGKFSQLISDFEAIHFHSDPQRKYEEFAKFLEYGAEGAYPEGWQDSQYANVDAVRIMTVHKGKGMQWPVVFVPALLRNRFPSKRQGGRSVWHLLDENAVDDHMRYRGSVEDERRLFYVAVTRSQKFLFLTHAPIANNRLYKRPSDFFEDVLVSKYVKRRRQTYDDRDRLEPQAKKSVANVTLSFSDVKYFFECPYQFKLRILYGFNAPIHEALGYGKSLHDALAEVHARAIRGDLAGEAEVEELVRRHLHVPYAYPALRETLEASARKVVSNYLADNAELLQNIEFSEKTISIDLGDGITVSGRIDLVRRLDTDETTIVDLKSKDRVQVDEVTETQLHIYALGYRELTGHDADFVEIYNLEERQKKPRSVDEDFIEDVRSDVRDAANSLRQNDFPVKTSHKACSTCDYLGMCSAGQRKVEGP